MFESMFMIAFQSVFRLEIYQNDIFISFTLFFISVHQNDLKIIKNINLKKYKKYF
jgi:hypothetical protein